MSQHSLRLQPANSTCTPRLHADAGGDPDAGLSSVVENEDLKEPASLVDTDVDVLMRPGEPAEPLSGRGRRRIPVREGKAPTYQIINNH
ncbi:hypothetical protein ACX9NE_16740 [Mycobacterium sp. ML4]